MLTIFFRSIGRHFVWWLCAFYPRKHPGAPLGIRRLIFLLLLFPVFFIVQSIHWLSFALDEILFPSYRRVGVKDPIFVTGIPRSGTTFVHRTLDADPGYNSFTTWEAALAPSICQRKLVRALGQLDASIGHPCKRLMDKMIRAMSGDFNNIHEVSLSAPEEDYLALLPAGACFIMALAFPYAKSLRDLGTFNVIAPKERKQILHFYHRCLQKQLYCSSTATRLLSKNAAFGSWTEDLAAHYPSARFIICIREPVSGLSSQLSSVSEARKLFGTDATGSATAAMMREIFSQNYDNLVALVDSGQLKQTVILDQADLKSDAGTLIRFALHQLGIPVAPEVDTLLTSIQPNSSSEHQHDLKDSPLDSAGIDACMGPAYRQLLKSSLRVKLPSQ